jgi:hypothetical protein
VVDQPFGAGHAVVIGSDPYFRAWNVGAQRLVLNAILYPGTAVIPGGTRALALARKQNSGPTVTPAVAKPLPKGKLPTVESRPLHVAHDPSTDAVITVKASRLGTLKKIVAAAKLPAAVRRHVRWQKGPRPGQATLRILSASTYSRDLPGDPSTKGAELWIHNDLELRPSWAWRIIHGLVDKRLHTYSHQI